MIPRRSPRPRLSTSMLLDNVALVESKEHKIDEIRFRQFKLEATLKRDIELSKDDVVDIKKTYDETT